jgi:hypothetical protein
LPWLPYDEPVRLRHIIVAARKLRINPAEAADLLTAFGFEVTHVPALPARITGTDLKLVSRNFDGTSPWLREREPVPPGHLIHAAKEAGRSIPWVAQRLSKLGFTVRDMPALTASVADIDLRLISRKLDGSPPWLRGDTPVTQRHIIRAARTLHLAIPEAADRLIAFGFSVPDIARPIADATRDDLRLISQDLDGISPWLSDREPITAVRQVHAAVALRRDITYVANRLAELGFPVNEPRGFPSPHAYFEPVCAKTESSPIVGDS